jgi:hypothetical protein
VFDPHPHPNSPLSGEEGSRASRQEQRSNTQGLLQQQQQQQPLRVLLASHRFSKNSVVGGCQTAPSVCELLFFSLVKISLLVFSISYSVAAAAEEDDHSYIGHFIFWLASCWVVGRSD